MLGIAVLWACATACGLYCPCARSPGSILPSICSIYITVVRLVKVCRTIGSDIQRDQPPHSS